MYLVVEYIESGSTHNFDLTIPKVTIDFGIDTTNNTCGSTTMLIRYDTPSSFTLPNQYISPIFNIAQYINFTTTLLYLSDPVSNSDTLLYTSFIL